MIFTKNSDTMETFDISKVKRVHNSPDGNCLFYAIGSALRLMHIDPEVTTVELLRYVVAESITKDHFDMLKSIWDSAVNERELPLLKTYSFMKKGQYSINHLKEVVQTTEYWGDEMALTAIEQKTKIKIHVIEFSLQTTKFSYLQRIDTIKPHSETKQILLLLLASEQPHYQLLIYDNKPWFNEHNKPPFIP